MKDIILESISDGVFTVDEEWRISYFNRAAEAITEIPREDAQGRYCYEVFKSNMCEGECPLRMTMRTSTPIIDKGGYIINGSGERIPISVSTALLRDSDGKVVGGAETFRDLRDIEELKQRLAVDAGTGSYTSRSPSMRAVIDLLPTVAASDATVLIRGETGTGKEVIARTIHAQSSRSAGPFVAVNCAALPEALLESELFGYRKGAFTGAVKDKPGRFKLADRGTLFLDEIGELSPAVQAKLLRVLQDGEYEPLGAVRTERTSARILCATNRDLRELVEQGIFRQDLYYRVNVVAIDLPPLRERKEDIPDLAEHFLRTFSLRMGKRILSFSEDVYTSFYAYDWPGNIRELENAVERAVVLCRGERIKQDILPPEIITGSARVREVLGKRMSEEEHALRIALEQASSNRSKAAELLGIHRATLYRRMKKYGIDV